MASQLDAKELQQIGRQILKAAESGDPASTVLDLLKPLENFRATEDLLRQSKIGIAITKLRQNKDPKVAETASKLVNRWKQEVNAKKKKAGSDSRWRSSWKCIWTQRVPRYASAHGLRKGRWCFRETPGMPLARRRY
jgi:hypothetical protein